MENKDSKFKNIGIPIIIGAVSGLIVFGLSMLIVPRNSDDKKDDIPTPPPTILPTPTIVPTEEPINEPTLSPTVKPTATSKPTVKPTTTPKPTVKPTAKPTDTPIPTNNDTPTEEARLYFDGTEVSCAAGKKITVNLNSPNVKDKSTLKIVSSDKTIATVDVNPSVQPRCISCRYYEISCKKKGTAVIEASTASGLSAKITVNVK